MRGSLVKRVSEVFSHSARNRTIEVPEILLVAYGRTRKVLNGRSDSYECETYRSATNPQTDDILARGEEIDDGSVVGE